MIIELPIDLVEISKRDIAEFQDRAQRALGIPLETIETAGCTGNCPTYPGAPLDSMGLPDCGRCPQLQDRRR